MIDWNRYKGEATEQIKTLTGRNLKILGDVQVSLFPTPAIIANDVSLSNLPGAVAPEMVKLRRAEVRIALSPLLAGQIKVETVRLIDPVIELELLADGRQSWDIQLGSNQVKPPPQALPAPSGTGGSPANTTPSVVFDDFTIVNGALNYRDSKTGTIEQIEGLNARIEAASLSGPFQSKGSLQLRSIPLTYDITVGEVIKERTLPLNMKFGVGAGQSSLHIGGTILGLSDEPKFKGSLKGEGKNLGLLIEAITRAPAPAALAQLFSIEGNISGSIDGAELSDLSMQLAESRVEGDVAIEMGPVPRFSISLTAGRFDLDKWLAVRPSNATTVSTVKDNKTAGNVAPTPTPIKPTEKIAVVIPNTINGSVIVAVDALVYRGEAIKDVLINTELVDGLVNLGQFSAQFPGGSDITMSGLLMAPGGTPDFTGTVETSTNDLRKVVDWLGVEFPDIPTDRLHKIDFASDVKLTPGDVQLQNMDLKFDSSRLTGAATIALSTRLGLGVNLTLDQIDLDAYMPRLSVAPAAEPTEKPLAAAKPADDAVQNTVPAPENSFAGLRALAGFDANALINIKRMAVRGEPLNNVTVDVTLFDGNLNIRKLNLAQFAGVTLAASGKLLNLRDVPSFSGLRLQANTKDPTAAMRFAGVSVPFDPKNLGATSIDLTADGSVLKPKIQTKLLTADANVSANGVLSLLPVGDLFNGDLAVEHPDFARLLRVLGVNYRPVGKLGDLSLTTLVSGTPTLLNFQKLSGNLGKLTYSGLAKLRFDEPVPHITADLSTGALILDQYLPASSSANLGNELWRALKRRPVVWPGPGQNLVSSLRLDVASSDRWPSDAIDLSALNAINADVKFKAPLVAYSKYLFERVDVAAKIENGILESQKISANLFGGQLNGNARLMTGTGNKLETVFDISGIQIADALTSVTGNAAASGLLNAKMNVAANGLSIADFVSSLSGTGGFAMTGVDVTSGAKGSAFAGIYNLLSSLNRLGSKRTGNKTDVAGNFQINQGVASTRDLKLVSALGDGTAQGTVDLGQWLLNITGQIELQQNALTQILQAKLKRGASPVGFSLTGPLDSPDVDIDTGALLGGSLPIPGADVLLNKAPKGIGKLLKGILGGGSATPSTPPPVQAPSQTGDTPPPARTTQQPPSSKEFTTEDLLNKLFK